MACGATLKRSLDFDPLHSGVSASPSHAPISTRTPPSKRRRLSPRCGYSAGERHSSMNSPPPQSQFKQVLPISSEKILKNIFDEYKRMKRRKQLHFNPEQTQPIDPSTLPSLSLAQVSGTSLQFASPQQPSSSGQPDKKLLNTPLLTMKQVSMICERLLKEQEEKIRSDYDKVLVNKLSEQYDAFVKFNYDQVQRRFDENPASYVS